MSTRYSVEERAYDNPKFVEDLVRDAAVALNKDRRVLAYRVEIENFESIHNHSAFARVVRPSPAAMLGQLRSTPAIASRAEDVAIV